MINFEKLEIVLGREERGRGSMLPLGGPTRNCKPNGFGTHHVLYFSVTHTPKNPWYVVCPHTHSLFPEHLHKYPYHLFSTLPSPPTQTLLALASCFLFLASCFLPSSTFTLSKTRSKWPLESQASSHKQQSWSRFSRDVQAWARNNIAPMMKMASLLMSRKAILLSTLASTEADTLFQSLSCLILSFNACFDKLRKSLVSIMIWGSLSLVKKSFFAL